MKRIYPLVFMGALMCHSATADDYVEWVGANSGVNWSAGQAQAEGVGIGPDGPPPTAASLMACRAAVVDAQRNLLESMQGVRVQGTTLVSNMMIESDVIKTTVEGVLEGARIIEREPNDDGTCRVTMTAPLAGQFASRIYEEVFDDEQATGSAFDDINPAEWLVAALDWLVPPASAAEPASWQDAFRRLSGRMDSIESLIGSNRQVVQIQTRPTGLVLDARGSNFIPSMSPRIRKLRENVIYPNKRHESTRRERGQLVSLFTRDLETARNHPIVGERPLVLKGLRTFGETRTEIVLDTEASSRLETLIENGFLDDAGVVIVL